RAGPRVLRTLRAAAPGMRARPARRPSRRSAARRLARPAAARRSARTPRRTSAHALPGPTPCDESRRATRTRTSRAPDPRARGGRAPARARRRAERGEPGIDDDETPIAEQRQHERALELAEITRRARRACPETLGRLGLG